MEIAAIIEAVCEIAKTLEERGDVSVITLLHESGYLERPKKITEHEILTYLKRNPDLIDSWVLYSENQRTPQGWYIRTSAEGNSRSSTWIVGWFPNGEIHKFHDIASACAFFVKREVEEIRSKRITDSDSCRNALGT